MNQNIGIGFSESEAMLNMFSNIKKSDARLLVPALFLGYQSMELYIKGLLLLKNEKIEYSHDVKNFYEQLAKCYGKESDIYRDIDDFYQNQIEILNDYKEESPEVILTAVKEELEKFAGDAEQFDDVTMLCLKYKG